ncbi:hypothetical protein OAF27_02460 [Verrucomicrobiales bacterium]|nr:hypothetical protein [Verrucomicrobiales bacterium]
MEIFKQHSISLILVSPLVLGFLTSCETTTPVVTQESPPAAPAKFAPPATVEEPVTVTSVKVLKLESYPVQAFAYITGTLPSSDSKLNKPRQTRAAQTIEISLTTTRPNPGSGSGNPTPFEKKIPLEVEGLRAGNYYVVVNGAESTLTLTRDNTLDTAPTTPVRPAAAVPLSPVESLPFTGTPH